MLEMPISNCPSCGSNLVWSNTGIDLFCRNQSCEAQSIRNILHFFGTIANIDGFGPKTIEKLIDNGWDTIPEIYLMQYTDFQDCGYKHQTIMNLGSELEASKERPIEPHVFLAALGIKHLGISSSKEFCKKYKYDQILDVSDRLLIELDGFGYVKSNEIMKEVEERESELFEIINIGFNTQEIENKIIESNFTGKRMTFTGKMSGNRKEMEQHAESLGAIITGVNSKSDYLITGLKVGANKINAANKFGITILTEEEYKEMI